MGNFEAQKIIESLRLGIPPEEKLSLLTVGRQDEINRLKEILRYDGPQSLLINANYGCGKTHLLKFIKEEALKSGFVASLVTLDSKSNARFNRMDQIFGQICRNIQVPNHEGKGFRLLFDALFDGGSLRRNVSSESKQIMLELSNGGKWDYSYCMKSQSVYIAVRAWKFTLDNGHVDNSDVKNLVEDWFYNTSDYQNQRSLLYKKLIGRFPYKFKDPRPEWKFYDTREGIFNFQAQSYEQSWNAISDLHKLSQAAGYRGLVLLFDEFEDVIYNLQNIKFQQSAFLNLFQFFSRMKFPGLTFFAVTPNFVEKCKNRLKDKFVLDFDYSKFDKLEKFEITSLSSKELVDLSEIITRIHEEAYGWKTVNNTRERIINICNHSSKYEIGNRVRTVIQEIIRELDKSESL